MRRTTPYARPTRRNKSGLSRPGRRGWLAAKAAAEQLHHIDFGAGRGGRVLGAGTLLACGVRRLGAAAARAANRQRPVDARRHDVQVLQVLVEIGVDAVDFRQRCPIQLLQDRELRPRLGLDRLQRFRESLDDGGGRERIAIGFEIRLPEQVADPPVQELKLFMAQVFDHPGDVARHH